ncbi:MAG: S-ribosylhomocysteine lyase [Clostridia bacterium]|nr:S-ribosylhomocysteine lyase [Clostridia bacterium]
MRRIASFSVDHDYIVPGIYLSRVDGDITTYDLRTRVPNTGDLMDNATMHSVEHMFATMIRNGELGENVIYFGPMGCQTGFYLLMRDAEHEKVLREIERVLEAILAYDGEIFGKSRKECGNYINLDLELAKAECRRYLKAVKGYPVSGLAYPKGEER